MLLQRRWFISAFVTDVRGDDRKACFTLSHTLSHRQRQGSVQDDDNGAADDDDGGGYHIYGSA